jgi:diaminohydroxyphosphoribosylaminopyrimidine deaminase/5-amino-6-(5-phosphoribosylamino)uracil reductase
MSGGPAHKERDEAFMQRALELARARLGKVAPNPAVACVLVKDGAVVGEGATGDGGRPHAEEVALQAAGDMADGATAYVSLEPCNARTSARKSCAQLLIEARVKRVVVACEDPNPPAAHGVSRLGAAGVEVKLGVLREEAEALNRGFFKLTKTGRPWLAIDADATTYDAEFDLQRNETYEAALDRMGKDGVTRIYVRPGTPLAAQLRARGLIDKS